MVTAFGIAIDCADALMLMPAIENPFETDIASTQCVLNTCARLFAMTMVAGGCRKVMLVGLSVFPFASVRCFIARTFVSRSVLGRCRKWQRHVPCRASAAERAGCRDGPRGWPGI